VKTPALVAVEAEPRRFSELFAAARQAGVRIGWLDLKAMPQPPAELASAVECGVSRAVAAGGRQVVSLKALRGEPVLRDLLREHFVGFAVVLLRSASGWPKLRPDENGFRLETASGDDRQLDAAGLLRELCRPRHRA